MLAALLPLYCFIGWEGAADLAEETNDPRSVTPFAMIRANYVSVAASLFMIVGFLIAIPHGIGRRCSASRRTRWSTSSRATSASVAADVLQVVGVPGDLLLRAGQHGGGHPAGVRAVARQDAARARPLLGRVNTRTRTPVASIVLVAVVGIGINLLSAGVAANVVSICSVAYYFIYLLTVGGAIYAHVKRHHPGAPVRGLLPRPLVPARRPHRRALRRRA